MYQVEPTKKKEILKKVEHIWKKSVKMELKEETMNGEPNMLYNYFTEKLIGLQELKITNIENEEKTIIIYAEMERKEHTCICCGATTDVIHDYRKQNIKDISILHLFGGLHKIGKSL